jgi:hypothetical protein
MEYYWKLQKYNGQNTRFRCPNCDKQRQYTRFVNSKGEYASYEYGKCNRVEKCGYFNYPNGVQSKSSAFVKNPVEEIEFIDWKKYKYELDLNNSFIQALRTHFKDDTAIVSALNRYKVKTVKESVVYPYINDDNRLTYVKLIEYKGINRTSQIYTPFKADKGTFKQCLFGLHLVSSDKENCIVESEKTALICSIKYPKYTWLATGGLNLISRINSLESGIVFADKGKAFNVWSDRVNSSKFKMNDTLEKTDLKDGSDLADLILSG